MTPSTKPRASHEQRFPRIQHTDPKTCLSCGAKLLGRDRRKSDVTVVPGIVEFERDGRTKRRKYEAIRRFKINCKCGAVILQREYLAPAAG